MKQVIGTAAGFILGGPMGAFYGFQAGNTWDQNDKAKKAAKSQAAASQRVEHGQRRQIADSDNERKRMLQEGSSIMRRRGALTSYAGAA